MPSDEPILLDEMRRLARENPRYGYRRIHQLLLREGWQVNHKRVHRVLRREGMADISASGYLAFYVDEEEQGMDLNADGDQADQVLHVYSRSTQLIKNTEAVSGGALPSIRHRVFGFFGPAHLGSISEAGGGGSDLNGDGDAEDRLLRLHRFSF